MPDRHEWLVSYLHEHDAACPGCRYSLRNLTSKVCPECGEPVQLQVGLVEPKMKLWLLGVVGLSFGAGLNAMLLVYALIVATIMRRGGPPYHPFVTHNAIGFAVEGVLLIALLRFGGRVRRAGRGARMMIALIAWGLTIANVIIFSLLIR